MGAKRSGNPLDRSAFLNGGTLGIQIVHILGVSSRWWNNEALHFFDEQLHAACMQVCYVIFWSGTSLDEMKACALVHDDQCMLKLTSSFGIQPEIRLQRNGHVHALWHIDERTTRYTAPCSAANLWSCGVTSFMKYLCTMSAYSPFKALSISV